MEEAQGGGVQALLLGVGVDDLLHLGRLLDPEVQRRLQDRNMNNGGERINDKFGFRQRKEMLSEVREGGEDGRDINSISGTPQGEERSE